MTVLETPGRRELNKARTRDAIVSAVRRLLDQHPVADLTADQVAEEAGISRRTFFNYFSGIPAVLIEVLSGYAVELVCAISPDLLREDPVEALRQVVRTEGLPAGFVDWIVTLHRHRAPGDSFVLVERTVWAQMGAWLEGVLVDLLPDGVDPLYVSTLAGSVMNAFSAAENAWLTGTDSPTAADPAAFDHHLDRALGYLAQGWRATPYPSPSPDRKDH